MTAATVAYLERILKDLSRFDAKGDVEAEVAIECAEAYVREALRLVRSK